MCLSCHFFRRPGRETGRRVHRQIIWMCSAVERQTIEQTGIWVTCCWVVWLQLKQPSTLLSIQLSILVFWHSQISRFTRPDINVYRVYLLLQCPYEFLWLIEATTGKANFFVSYRKPSRQWQVEWDGCCHGYRQSGVHRKHRCRRDGTSADF